MFDPVFLEGCWVLRQYELFMQTYGSILGIQYDPSLYQDFQGDKAMQWWGPADVERIRAKFRTEVSYLRGEELHERYVKSVSRPIQRLLDGIPAFAYMDRL